MKALRNKALRGTAPLIKGTDGEREWYGNAFMLTTEDILSDYKLRKGQELKDGIDIKALLLDLITRTSPVHIKEVNEDVAVLSDGVDEILLDPYYLALLQELHPNASIEQMEGGAVAPVVLKEGDKIVAIVMPRIR